MRALAQNRESILSGLSKVNIEGYEELGSHLKDTRCSYT